VSDELIDDYQAPEDSDVAERARLTQLWHVADDAITAGLDVMPAAVWPRSDGTLAKAPLLAHGHLDAHHERQLIRQQLLDPPHVPDGVPDDFDIVVGCLPGSGGFVVLDCDVKSGKAGLDSLQRLLGQHGHFLTAAWQSPSGGINVLLRKPTDARYSNSSPWTAIDVRADGGWVVAPGTQCRWGAWVWGEHKSAPMSYVTASALPSGMAEQLKPSSQPGRRATNAATVAFIEASPSESTLPVMQRFAQQLDEFRHATDGSRHDALVRIVSWAYGMHALDLRDATARIRDVWLELTGGERREDEVAEVACWVVGQERGKRQSAPGTTSLLPDEFWSRSRHAVVRDAAQLVDVSAEALMLGVCAAVAAHIPPAVGLRGPRRGTADLLVCVVGPPGDGKGEVLDRSHQLVKLPADATLDRLGTSQGLVKRGYKRNPDLDARATQPYVRREGAIVVRCDEISSFAGRTRNGTPQGDDLLGTLKSAVSGEGLGGGFAGDDKNLPLHAGTYRLVGVLGIAPDKATPLFGDLGGGFPERLLFAYVAGDDDGSPVDERRAVDAARPCDPIAWTPPPLLPGREWFETDPAVLAEIATGRRSRRRSTPDPYAAHHDLLRHKLAAVLAYLDGRWGISADDWRLAGMLVVVSVAARTRLLDDIAAEAERWDEWRRNRAAKAEVAKVRAVREDEEAARLTRVVDRARDLVSKVAAEPGISPADLRRKIRHTNRDEVEPALDHAVEMGWLVVTELPGQGEARRAVTLGPLKP
jgi:hypothetical protein